MDYYYFGALTFRDVPDLHGVPKVPGVRSRERSAVRFATQLQRSGIPRSVLVEEFGSVNGREHLHFLVRFPPRPREHGRHRLQGSFDLSLALGTWRAYDGYVKSEEVGDFGATTAYCAKYLTKAEGRMWVDGVRL